MMPLVLTLLALLLAAPARPQADAETLRSAKTLFFDRQYAEAREAWRAVHAAGVGREAQSALYWIARCSEKLGEHERALAEYGGYLDTRPSDRTLGEEARTSRVALAARLYKAGKTRYRRVLDEALDERSRTVRYFAALQMASLGREVGRRAVPVLREILEEETDPDLVERAKLALLRLDRSALAEATPPSRAGVARAGWIRVRIWDKGSRKPQLSINLPVALAEMVFKSLPDSARDKLREEGYDADSFWERLKTTGPAEILTIEGGDGTRIQVWIE
jgi:tetratricopeptide (TPR) repeat protein